MMRNVTAASSRLDLLDSARQTNNGLPDRSGGHPSETVGAGNRACLISSLDGETRYCGLANWRPALLTAAAFG